MTISEVRGGHGRQKGHKRSTAAQDIRLDLLPKVKLEMVCHRAAPRRWPLLTTHGRRRAEQERLGMAKSSSQTSPKPSGIPMGTVGNQLSSQPPLHEHFWPPGTR